MYRTAKVPRGTLDGALRKGVGRAGISLIIFGICALILSQRMQAFDSAAMLAAFTAVTAAKWVAALGAVALSYIAIGQYDVVILRHLRMPRPEGQTRRSGITALAISQTVGLGLVSGALVRWRMMPGIDITAAFRITLAVGLSFMAAAAFLAAVLHIWVAGPMIWAAWAVVLAGLGIAALCVWRPALPLTGRKAGPWPNLFTLGQMVALTAIDGFAAGLALWILLPAGVDIGLLTLMAGFMLALLAGLASGTPAGLGAFELVLLGGLPTLAPEVLLGAVMAWRLAYFAIPSLLAMAALATPPAPLRTGPMPAVAAPVWPEAGLVAQGQLWLSPTVDGHSVVLGRTGHSLCALGPAAIGAEQSALHHLCTTARAEGRIPVLYKASARLAARARRHGLATTCIAREAVIRPQDFTLATPPRAGLRRKLRHASTAGVTISHDPQPDMAALAAVAADWSARHGGERGFSMGRFCPLYLRGQRVFTARQNGAVIAFVSFHTSASGWTLDLMRHSADLPDGTMHALVAAAIEDARRANMATLSLAAVPEGAFGGSAVMQTLAKRGGGAGLLRFKSAFAPAWQPLYLCAPGWAGLVLAAIGLARAIHAPPPPAQVTARKEAAYHPAAA